MNSIKFTLQLIVLFSIITSCKDEQNQHKETVLPTKYPLIVKNWEVSTLQLNKTTQEKVEQWNELKLLQLELSEKPQATLGSIRQKTKALSEKALKVRGTVPDYFLNRAVTSRLKVVYSNIKMLETHAHQDYLDVKELNYYTKQTIESYSIFIAQLEHQVLKKEFKFEDVN